MTSKFWWNRTLALVVRKRELGYGVTCLWIRFLGRGLTRMVWPQNTTRNWEMFFYEWPWVHTPLALNCIMLRARAFLLKIAIFNFCKVHPLPRSQAPSYLSDESPKLYDRDLIRIKWITNNTTGGGGGGAPLASRGLRPLLPTPASF